MTTRTQVMLSCDLCGNVKDVRTWTFGLDGKAYEIDLCPQDSKGMGEVAAGYLAKARKVTARQGPRRNGRQSRPRGAASRGRSGASGGKASGRGQAAGTKKEAKASGSGRQAGDAGGAQQQKGIYVYGILPADIEVAGETPGVGEHPGPLRVVSADGVAALVSEVDLSGTLGSADDRRTHREILDATATEVPVLPLRFGAVLASEDQVAGELLAAHHDEFAAALQQLEGRAQFLVKGRYLETDSEAAAARREQDTQALVQAMEGHCAASVAREPADELDAVHVAFLVDAGQESELERVTEQLARDWEGRIEVQLLGPMAAYDFVSTGAPQG